MPLLSEFEKLETEKLIARKPAFPRDSSRLMIVNRKSGAVAHTVFGCLPEYINRGDCLVINDTKVVPAVISGVKKTGGKLELLITGPAAGGENCWFALSRNAKEGVEAVFPEGLKASCKGRTKSGEWMFEFAGGDFPAYLAKHGAPPLPHYIIGARKKYESSFPYRDGENYQTVYAANSGSIAAPTAGFHFTGDLLDKITAKGAFAAKITLHVGWGTFRPVTADRYSEHKMLEESCRIPPASADIINEARKQGGRIIAVGTSSVRTLETFASDDGTVSAGEAASSIFIYPGYKFKAVDSFITNFHLPKSAPLCMTAAFAGEALLFNAYRRAVEEKYRFYSYGDAMLII